MFRRNQDPVLDACRESEKRASEIARQERRRRLSLLFMVASGILATANAVVDPFESTRFYTFVLWILLALFAYEHALFSVRLLRVAEWLERRSLSA
jgi:hypothetical protein